MNSQISSQCLLDNTNGMCTEYYYVYQSVIETNYSRYKNGPMYRFLSTGPQLSVIG